MKSFIIKFVFLVGMIASCIEIYNFIEQHPDWFSSFLSYFEETKNQPFPPKSNYCEYFPADPDCR